MLGHGHHGALGHPGSLSQQIIEHQHTSPRYCTTDLRRLVVPTAAYKMSRLDAF